MTSQASTVPSRQFLVGQSVRSALAEYAPINVAVNGLPGAAAMVKRMAEDGSELLIFRRRVCKEFLALASRYQIQVAA